MRGGKDWNNNTMEPLFPRLHVKDREKGGKGGPKPPPRNKMAVHEELITLSSSSSDGSTTLLPLHVNGIGQIRHAGSPGQVGGPERRTFSAFCCPPTSSHTTPRLVPMSQSYGIMSNISETSAAKPLGDAVSCVSGDSLTTARYCSFQQTNFMDFKRPSCNEDKVEVTFPSLAHQGECLGSGSKQHDLDQEEINSPAMNSLIQSQQACTGNRLKRASVCDQDRECQGSSKKMSLAPTARASVLSQESSKPLLSDGVSRPAEESNTTLKYSATEQTNVPGNSLASFLTTESFSGSLIGDKKGAPGNNSQCVGVVHKNEHDSDSTMADFMTNDIFSLDDVVLKIRRENFWKLRRILINQEIEFSIHVFELHRLVQVQRSLAGSSHHSIEDKLRLHKCSYKVSNKEKLLPPLPPLPTYVQPNESLMFKPADNSAKESHHGRRRRSSSMIMANINIPGTCSSPPASPPPIEFKDLSLKTGNSLGTHLFPPLNCNSNEHSLSGHLYVKSTSTPLLQLSDTCFHPPPENQWLVPLMSSEGLVYKPCAGPMNLPAGGSRPYLLNTAYRIPMMLSYLDPCGFSSTKLPPEEAVDHAGSSDSAGSSSVQGVLSLFPLEPPAVAQSSLRSSGSEKRRPTIKAVPRHGKLATESVMRIFKSIQEEPRQS